ncbi:hypothetical protein PTSG_02548 [Salpingoeca rosetta]|uniref:Nucleolar complex protein 2 homolog n=1 Tax=Salpingoeca rosetta (strain ATCC 50818 / BSB-021) TaxID=946362 RepID=F2U2I1_SALR5|nr:uncharacterized protein PTSG_02548 [Salpingoeca rosetta]EGD81833.1 hypothetical protein PTSG_02548 [Salpingoeca rosetta]|eukprot:XP_004997037.1 hypothetical protein PTSG_02548 [Salpingoeca rosetta]
MNASEHAQQLEELKKSDPEFYKFLLKEDKSLLSFGEEVAEDEEDKEQQEDGAAEGLMDEDEDEADAGDVSFDDDDEAQEDEEEEKEVKGKKGKKGKKEKKTKADKQKDAKKDKAKKAVPTLEQVLDDETNRLVTVRLVNYWSKRLRLKPLGTIRKLVIAFHSVSQTDSPHAKKKDGDLEQLPKFTVATPAAYNALMHLTLSQVPAFLHSKINVKDNKTDITTQPSWKKVKTVIKAFTTATLTLIKQATNQDMLVILVKTLSQLAPFVNGLPKLRRSVVKDVVAVFTREQAPVTVAAVLLLRQFLYYATPIVAINILKSTYMAYVRCTKFVNLNNHEHVRLMRTAVKELFLQDPPSAYQLAFVYIRQLSVHVRDALALKRATAMQTVHSWQFVACIQLWAEVLADGKKNDKDHLFESLSYPLIQVAIGSLSLSVNARHFPMHFHVLRALISLGAKTRTTIPLAPHILAPLNSAEMMRRPIRRMMKPLNMALLLAFPKAHIGTKPFQDAVLQEVTGLMLQYLHPFSAHIGFPELAISIQAFCRTFTRKCKVPETRRAVKTLSDQIENNSAFILQHRGSADHSPLDTEKNDAFEAAMQQQEPPLQKYVELWKAHELKKQKLLKSHGTVPEDDIEDEKAARRRKGKGGEDEGEPATKRSKAEEELAGDEDLEDDGEEADDGEDEENNNLDWMFE